MSKNSNRIRTDIAVVRPAGSKGEMYDLEFLGQQNTQNLIDATVQRIQNKKKWGRRDTMSQQNKIITQKIVIV